MSEATFNEVLDFLVDVQAKFSYTEVQFETLVSNDYRKDEYFCRVQFHKGYSMGIGIKKDLSNKEEILNNKSLIAQNFNNHINAILAQEFPYIKFFIFFQDLSKDDIPNYILSNGWITADNCTTFEEKHINLDTGVQFLLDLHTEINKKSIDYKNPNYKKIKAINSLDFRGKLSNLINLKTMKVDPTDLMLYEYLKDLNEKGKFYVENYKTHFFCSKCQEVKPKFSFSGSNFTASYCKVCEAKYPEVKNSIKEAKRPGYYE